MPQQFETLLSGIQIRSEIIETLQAATDEKDEQLESANAHTADLERETKLLLNENKTLSQELDESAGEVERLEELLQRESERAARAEATNAELMSQQREMQAKERELSEQLTAAELAKLKAENTVSVELGMSLRDACCAVGKRDGSSAGCVQQAVCCSITEPWENTGNLTCYVEDGKWDHLHTSVLPTRATAIICHSMEQRKSWDRLC